MEYIYGTTRLDGVLRENLKTIGAGPPLKEGEYITTVRECADSAITDRCRIERLYRQATGIDGTPYAFYVITDHYRYMERGDSIASRVDTLKQEKAEQADVDELHEALDMILTGVTE